ncbi:uncharacterized protein LOC125510885 isoform X2 [Triticum urartu]|uniref:uncharacterized protein LOC125510885 isoform X2 n=1 Tax=Triticum urartu TaxID=4572 RepID=UPI002042BE78|nr:uncharacterized protein LOC125510885 isoform X2 [Triticum urartu]
MVFSRHGSETFTSPSSHARPHPSLCDARSPASPVPPLPKLLPRPLSPAPPLPELLPRPRRQCSLPRAHRRRSTVPTPSLKMRFFLLRLSNLQWRCSICGVGYQDGATELLLPVACPELLPLVVRPDLLLQAMPTLPSPSRSSSSSSSVTSPPQHQRRGCWEGEGRMDPSSSRTTIAEQSRKLVSEINRCGADVVEYIFWNGYEPAKVQPRPSYQFS